LKKTWYNTNALKRTHERNINMPQKIVRIYGSAAQGSKAAAHLRDLGFEHVFQFSGPASTTSSSSVRGALITDMMNAQLLKNHAETYANRLTNGQSLVLVHAPFGSSNNATEAMDGFEPIDVGISETNFPPVYQWDDAAPLSSALQIPVLTETRLVAETLTGVSSLTRGKAFLSDLYGIPLLSRGSADQTNSMGFPMLSQNAALLSSALGFRTISNNATPLSSLLGLPVLSSRR
jgi:hypothetical protein